MLREPNEDELLAAVQRRPLPLPPRPWTGNVAALPKPIRHMNRTLTVLVLLTSLHAPRASAAPASATSPALALRPAVPALVIGQRSPAAFVVDGTLRVAKRGAIAFRVVTDGDRQLCAVDDPADGTPLVLSDGEQTLLYELDGDRVLLMPNCRAYVRLDWDAAAAKPIAFSLGAAYERDPADLARIIHDGAVVARRRTQQRRLLDKFALKSSPASTVNYPG